jgi:chaperonin GroEL
VALLRCRAAVAALDVSGDERVGRDLVLAALAAPARQIAHNAGEDGPVVVARILTGEGPFGWDARHGRYGDLIAAGIIDPAKVTRVALQNAASIGGLLLTTDAVVVDEDDADEESPE